MSLPDDVTYHLDLYDLPPLTEAERAQLAALAEMPDEAIDTSDISSLTEAFFTRAVHNRYFGSTRYQFAIGQYFGLI